MNIFVIGGNSTLAKSVVPVLSKDHKVTTAGPRNCDVFCDVTKNVEMPKFIDVVINFAAAFGGDSDEEILAAEKTNVLGTLNVCMAAAEAEAKHIVLISSIFTLLEKKSPFYSSYALTKKQAEELAAFYCSRHNLSLTILQPSQIYGDTDEFAKHQPFFYHIIDAAQRGEDITIYGSNDAKRNYIHVADLAEIIARAIKSRLAGIFVCMAPDDLTYVSIAEKAQQIFDKGGKVKFLKSKPDIPDNVFAKDTSIYERLNYWPQVSITNGIERIKKQRQAT